MTNATLTIFSLLVIGSVAFCLRLADNGVRGFGKTRRIPGQQFRLRGFGREKMIVGEGLAPPAVTV